MVVSVILCTKNRGAAILPTLDSIAAAFAEAAPLDAEIIVVDNGSTDDTLAVCKEWLSACAFPVRLVFEPKPGVNACRNRGMAAAAGDLLVFTDHDCRLREDYVKELLRRDAADSELVVRGGRVELGDPTDLPLTIHAAPTAKHWHRQASCRMQPQMVRGRPEKLSVGGFWGCNMAARREAAECIGPFDERFGAGASIPGGDDTDWAFRAYLANMGVEYVPDLVVFHHHGRKSQSEGYSLLRNYAIAQGALSAKYFFKAPRFCYQLYRDIGGAIKELFFGTANPLLARCGFSRRKWLGYSVVGAVKYVFLVLRGAPASPRAGSHGRNAQAEVG